MQVVCIDSLKEMLQGHYHYSDSYQLQILVARLCLSNYLACCYQFGCVFKEAYYTQRHHYLEGHEAKANDFMLNYSYSSYCELVPTFAAVAAATTVACSLILLLRRELLLLMASEGPHLRSHLWEASTLLH